MNFVRKFLRRNPDLRQEDLVKPFCLKAKQAILEEDLPKAIAYLNCGIKLAPERLNLYLQRAQIFQYGLDNYSRALEDYRFILRKLESSPDSAMEAKCKQAMRDMMAAPGSGA
ncbi:tetratricopeptide repeat protein [Sulfidibacter corallicola]|uniref:Tetratricopeptide repeat protein n=1 Tax=Sulfidibacter corallicola TaxID=2818388 RepID=A0A8A4TSJ2_SULCO|nr:tetratricopeptide repeat protein [Sulfidibacter corallicola]QTD52939.1 hypothetical protein J3U87_10745 [Sulfidibacter corallicola]